MMDFFHTHSDFVAAAYGVTGGALVLLCYQSLRRYGRLRRVLKGLSP